LAFDPRFPPYFSFLRPLLNFNCFSFFSARLLNRVRQIRSPIDAGPNPASSIPSHYIQAKTDFFYAKPIQAGQTQHILFQAIPVRPKLTSSIPIYSSQAENDFYHSKPFQSGYN
jgi:hypothetical protein